MPLIFDIKRFALHDGPGIRTSIFFKGCPLRCKWCHNPESHRNNPEELYEIRQIDGKEISKSKIFGEHISEDVLLEEIMKDKVFYDESGGGATFTGGEPLMQYESLEKLLVILGRNNIHRVVDTSGYAPSDHIVSIAEHTDLFLYDLKQIDSSLHKKYTGVDNRLILNNADLLLDQGRELIFRIPIVPGVNDSDNDIDAFLNYLSPRKGKFREVHLLPFHKFGMNKYARLGIDNAFEDVEKPGPAKIEALKNKFLNSGFEVSIGG